jgi:hypothetical protein
MLSGKGMDSPCPSAAWMPDSATEAPAMSPIAPSDGSSRARWIHDLLAASKSNTKAEPRAEKPSPGAPTNAVVRSSASAAPNSSSATRGFGASVGPARQSGHWKYELTWLRPP